MVKMLSLRSALSLQEEPNLKAMLSKFFGGGNISSFLSSGILGLLAGKMLSPMFGLVVTALSFLLNSASKEATVAPPAPAAAK